MKFLCFDTQELCQIAANKIAENLGLPKAGTELWAIPAQAFDDVYWFITAPSDDGYTAPDGEFFSYAQMMSGVADFEIKDLDRAPVPPFEF